MIELFNHLSANVQMGTVKQMSVVDTGSIPVLMDMFKDDNLYFVEGISDAAKDKPRVKDEDIIRKSHTAIDIDYRSRHPECTDEDIVQVGKRLHELLLKTESSYKNFHSIVFTGNGLHVHYVGTPVEVSKEVWANGMELFIDQFAKKIGFEEEIDRACKNASRLWRVVGSYNCKKEKKLVRELHHGGNMFDMDLILQVGRLARKEQKPNSIKHKLISAATGGAYDQIQAIPIEEIVTNIEGWDFDGKNFHDVDKADNKGMFKPEGENYIVHVGTPHVSNEKSGYRPFEYVKQHFDYSNAETFAWFRDRYEYLDNATSKIKQDFITWEELVYKSQKEKMAMNKNMVCKFGIDVLDQCLGGIIPTDLVVVAAPTGQGKSELLMNIAVENSKLKTVLYYQLEMDNSAPVDRMVLKEANKNGADISASKFRVNDLTGEQRKECDKAYKKIAKKADQLLLYSGDALDFESFSKTFQRCDNVDLIVVDHLHYFSLEDGENMSASLGKVMRGIRNIVKRSKIPVVIASHLRKPFKPDDEPTQHDLFGSSNIAKEATNIILLYKQGDKTIVKVEKSRDTGEQRKFAGVFNPKTRIIENLKEYDSSPDEIIQSINLPPLI
jgi:hypothetical protein